MFRNTAHVYDLIDAASGKDYAAEAMQVHDAVVCLFSSIGYMGSTDELDRAITTMTRHLDRGGCLIVDGWVRPDACVLSARRRRCGRRSHRRRTRPVR